MKLSLPNYVDFNDEVFVSGKWTKTSITEKWQKGLISNFEYLMHLNTLAGRSFNDLTQYPVFPFILRDYTSEVLDLSNPESFRDLSKPMGAQDSKRLAKFVEKYQALVDMDETPYFFGSHYSNVGTVLHFLVRMEPFSSFFIEFQGGRFDVPDRTFYSMAQTWDLSSSLSQSDVKELIPEFFFLPEFLKNSNRFDFGLRQDGTVVGDVALPPWAKGSAREFVMMHIQALESDYVSEHLHRWIDLIFGSAQLGEAALVSHNLFHPYTYEGAVDIDKVAGQLERDAIITQINSYGQTPTQLFKKPHPPRSMKHIQASIASSDVLCAVGPKLQIFPLSRMPSGSVSKIDFSPTGQPLSLIANQEILWPEASHVLEWGHSDGSLVVAKSLRSGSISFSLDLHGRTQPLDSISCVAVSRSGSVIVAGSSSSLLLVWRQSRTFATRKTASASAASSSGSNSSHPFGLDEAPKEMAPTSATAPSTTVLLSGPNGDTAPVNITFAATLDGHLGPVTAIAICPPQNIFVSGSTDKHAVVWDINKLHFVRALGPHNGPVTAVAVQPFWGDIAVVDRSELTGGSTLHLWSVNGDKIGERTCESPVRALAFTSAVPGIHRNLVITGHDDGRICMWSHVDLTPYFEFSPSASGVVALSVSDDNTRLLVADAAGGIFCCATRIALVAGTS